MINYLFFFFLKKKLEFIKIFGLDIKCDKVKKWEKFKDKKKVKKLVNLNSVIDIFFILLEDSDNFKSVKEKNKLKLKKDVVKQKLFEKNGFWIVIFVKLVKD